MCATAFTEIALLVSDNLGADLTTHQDTPIAKYKEDTYVVFNVDVHIQKTLDSLPPGKTNPKARPESPSFLVTLLKFVHV